MIWFSEYKKRIDSLYGSIQAGEVNKYLSSILWKLLLTEYHSSESLRIFNELLPDDTTNPQFEVIKQIFLVAGGSDEAANISVSWFKSEAHIIAFAQALHSIADILAKAIYVGLDLDNNLRKSILPRRQNIFLVCDGMKSSNFSMNVVDSIEKLIWSQEFNYLHAYVNITKHHSLIEKRPAVSFEDGGHGIRISAFEHEKNGKHDHWPRKWASDFLREDFEIIKTGIRHIGDEILIFL